MLCSGDHLNATFIPTNNIHEQTKKMRKWFPEKAGYRSVGIVKLPVKPPLPDIFKSDADICWFKNLIYRLIFSFSFRHKNHKQISLTFVMLSYLSVCYIVQQHSNVTSYCTKFSNHITTCVTNPYKMGK